MPKFFVKPESIKDHKIVLDGENAKHIGSVLRAKIGEKIVVGDGQGRDYECEIESIDKKEVVAKIVDIFSNDNEPKVKITLSTFFATSTASKISSSFVDFVWIS